MVTPHAGDPESMANRSSILSGIINDIDIRRHLDELDDILSPDTTNMVSYSSDDLIREGKGVYSRDPKTGKTVHIASFATAQDAKTFIRHNTDSVRSQSQVGINRLKKFRNAWEEGDTEKQKELFEGFYLLASIHLGEDRANHLRAQFLESQEYRYLQRMVDAVASGQEGIATVKDMSATYNVNDPESMEAANAVNSVRYLSNIAHNDSYAHNIHAFVCRALESYMKILKMSDNKDDWMERREVQDVYTIFRETALIPNNIKKATPASLIPPTPPS